MKKLKKPASPYRIAALAAAKRICADYGIDGNGPEHDAADVETVADIIREEIARAQAPFSVDKRKGGRQDRTR